jgi:LCP family protein required for cell wall assembly
MLQLPYSSNTDKKYKPLSDNRPKKAAKGKVATLFIILALIFGSIAAILAGGGTLPSFKLPFSPMDLISQVTFFDKPLKGDGNKTNILILGKDYGRNTDTIIVASYYQKENQLTTMNIPRDLRVLSQGNSMKINALLAQGEDTGYQGRPSRYVADFISRHLNIPIDYFVRIDIDGVTKLVDKLGGIEVEVEQSFTDCEFPTPNYTGYIFPCPSFEKGKTILNSQRALIYARSRHSFDNPSEAIDFARSKRQSKVIEATMTKLQEQIKNNIFSLNLGAVNDYYTIVRNNIDTDMQNEEMLTLLRRIQAGNRKPTQHFSLSYDTGIICPDSLGTSDIIFCDGGALGQKNPSLKQQQLSNIAGDLLSYINSSKLFESKVALIGNGSNDTQTIYNSLVKSGFKEKFILLDNNYNGIKRATATSKETITIYIADGSLYELFKKSNLSSGLNYNIINQDQSKFKFTPAYEAADITILVE